MTTSAPVLFFNLEVISMTTTMPQQENLAATTLEAMAPSADIIGPDWLRALKRKAAAHFAELGLPTTRHEDWRYTNLDPIRQTAFVAPAETDGAVSLAELSRYDIAELDEVRAVFVDGRFDAALSDLDNLSKGVRIMPLAQAIEAGGEGARRHLGEIAHMDQDALAALNTACFEDGLYIEADENVIFDKPIRVLCIARSADQPTITHPRCLIVAAPGSKITVIEHYVSEADNVYFTNAVTEIEAAENAHVNHYILEQESEKAYNVSTLAFHQGDHSCVHSHTMLFGGALVRNNVNPQIDGEHCICLINGMYAPTGTQHVDNHMRVEHLKPHGDSRQFYKGVLLDHSRAVFSGRIIVSKGAQKTDAKQTNANLLLSDDAQVNAKPQLEIYADDVKCTHGATIGQLDEEALFYLESRGISKEAARGLMVYSFAAETFERIDCPPVRRFLEKALINRLPQGGLLDNVL